MKEGFFRLKWLYRRNKGGVDRYVYCSSCTTLHRYKWIPVCDDCKEKIEKVKRPKFFDIAIKHWRCVGCGYTNSLIEVKHSDEVEILCKNGAKLVVTLYDCCESQRDDTWKDEVDDE